MVHLVQFSRFHSGSCLTNEYVAVEPETTIRTINIQQALKEFILLRNDIFIFYCKKYRKKTLSVTRVRKQFLVKYLTITGSTVVTMTSKVNGKTEF